MIDDDVCRNTMHYEGVLEDSGEDSTGLTLHHQADVFGAPPHTTSLSATHQPAVQQHGHDGCHVRIANCIDTDSQESFCLHVLDGKILSQELVELAGAPDAQRACGGY